MQPSAALAGLFAALLVSTPALGQPQSMATTKQKMETCKFGAADQKLKGAEEKAFIRKCMMNEDPPAKSKPKPKKKPKPQTP